MCDFCRTVTPPQTTTRALRSGRCRETRTPQRHSEQRPAKTDTTSPVCCNEIRGLSPGSAGPAAPSGAKARAHPCGSPAVTQVNAVKVCQQTTSVAAGPHAQNEVGSAVGECMSVAVSAQPAAQPVQSSKASIAAQPTADGSAGKQTASVLEGCAASPSACATLVSNYCRLAGSRCAGPSLWLSSGLAGRKAAAFTRTAETPYIDHRRAAHSGL